MKLEIKEKIENPLLERSEVSGTIEFDKVTPGNEDVAKEIAGKNSVEPKLVVVKNIYTEFGNHAATFNANVYKNMAALEKNEMMTKHLKKKETERKKAQEEKKKAEAEAKAAQAQVTSAPVEGEQ